MSFSEQGLTQQELLKTNKELANKIIELEQQKNTLEQYLRIEKEVSNETIKELEQQKAELMEFISSKLSEAWSKMGDTGSSDYMSKLNDENYWFGYFSALDNAQDILNKYKQQEERDDNRT